MADFFCCIMSGASAQTVNLTSFQHSLRWLDEERFPPYCTMTDVNDSLLNAATHALQVHFNAGAATKPLQVAYKNIQGFGKPTMKNPSASSNAGDWQAAIFSFITRATTGYAVNWQMKVQVMQNGTIIYTHEIKHELKSYKASYSWFSKEEFITHCSQLLNELLENINPLASTITLGQKPINKDSILHAAGEHWAGTQNKELFDFGTPSFGDYQTYRISKSDTPVVKEKSLASRNTSVEVYNENLLFNQTKTIDKNTTTWFTMVLGKFTDSIEMEFAVYKQTRKEKETVAGFLFKKSGTDQERDYNFNRNVEGTIRVNSETPATFYLNNYVNKSISSGTVYLLQDTLSIETESSNGISLIFKLINRNGDYAASLFYNSSNIDIWIDKNLSETLKHQIAGLFALMVSIKKDGR